MKTKIILVLFPFLLLLTVFISSCQPLVSSISGIETGEVPQKVKDVFIENPQNHKIEVWQQDLEVPWSLVFLPNGDALISERPGRIRLIKDGKLQEEPYTVFDKTFNRSEAGLLGLAIHPDFKNKPFVYAYYTHDEPGKRENRVVRLKHENNKGVFEKVIVDQIPADNNHNGGGIKFGPDGMLYISTGENFEREMAQDMSKLGGKILRVTPEGEIPKDNPFNGSMIYSLGHRNPQGLIWHPETGDLFSSEHGPSGEAGLRGMDEINVIYKGSNYGWPKVTGAVNKREYVDPVVMWKETVPPGGITFWNGDLYVSTMKSESIARIKMKKNENGYEITGIEQWFASSLNNGKYGRFRNAVAGPDGALYVLTSNRDGRGNPQTRDDKILRITKVK